MIREIRLYPDPVLLRICEPVTVFDSELAHLVEDMFETMYHAPGVGLAAPQVGENLRLFVVNCDFEESGADAEIALVNPQILETREPAMESEGCLSFPGIHAEVERFRWVRIRYQDVTGEWHEREADGLLAQAFQHELDHLNGKVFIDFLKPDQLSLVARDIEVMKREFRRKQREQGAA